MKILLLVFIPFVFISCSSRPRQRDDAFFVDLRSHQEELGFIETQIERTFPRSGLRKIDVAVSYFPDEDAVCLFYRSDFFNYHQFWNASGREMFKRALEKYEEDYANRNLVNNNRRTANVYGEAEGFISWQMFTYTTRVQANTTYELGYAFSERFPYFAVTQKLTTYEDPIDINESRNSQEVTLFFTRAQAQALADFFDPVLLQEFTLGRRPRVNELLIEVDDDYFEYDEY